MHSIDLYDVPDKNGDVVHTFTFPGSWDEVTPDQLPCLAMARMSAPDSASVRFELLRKLARIPNQLMGRMPGAEHFMRRREDDGRKKDDQPVWHLLEQLDWVWGPASWMKSMLPIIKHKGIRYVGPGDDLDNVSIDQWAWLNTLLGAFNGRIPDDADMAQVKAEKLDLLLKWLGAAYRPEGTAWTNMDIEKNAIALGDLQLDQIMAAKLNYEALYTMVPERYPRVYDPTGPGGSSPAGSHALVIEVAKSGVYGTKNEAAKERMHEVLLYMEHSLYQQYRDNQNARSNTPSA